MKKIKSFFAVVILTAFTTSCTKEDALTTNEVQNQNVMRFASEKEMQDKIAEIETFKTNQETQILEKFLKRNNVKAPVLADIESIKSKNVSEFDKETILENVKFYHQEKLKAIYAERAHFGFTSIQSIADEINFLTLLNKNKSDEMFNKYSKFLNNNKNYTSPRGYSSVSLISNDNGIYKLKNLDVKIVDSETSKNSPLKEGILATNPFFGYTITYHAGLVNNNSNFTQFGSFIFGNLYPSWFYPTAASHTRFCQGLSCNAFYMPFPTGTGNIVRNSNSNNFLVVSGLAEGNFLTILNGQWISVSGSVLF